MTTATFPMDVAPPHTAVMARDASGQERRIIWYQQSPHTHGFWMTPDKWPPERFEPVEWWEDAP